MKQSTTQFTKNRRRRGSALLLVTVLVLLLAMMGTAFLVSARISREQITGTGSAGLAGPAGAFPSVPTAKFDDSWTLEVQNAVTTAVAGTLTLGGTPYRDGGHIDYVGVGVDPELRIYAPRAPFLPNPVGAPNDIRWSGYTSLNLAAPIIPGPPPALAQQQMWQPVATPGVVPPLTTAVNLPVAGMVGVRIGSTPITYATGAYTGMPSLVGRTRDYPAFLDAAGAGILLAADADGDGIADSPLTYIPEVTVSHLTYGAADGSLDGLDHPITFWYAVRIVDDAGAVNINTAWRSGADLDAAGNPIPAAATNEYALLGTFRSHIGLRDMIQQMADPTLVNTVAATQDGNTLDLYRMQLANASLQVPNEGAMTLRADIRFATQGDALEHQLARRLANPGNNADASGNLLPYQSDGTQPSQDDLAFRFMMLDRSSTTSPLVRTHLPNAAVTYAVNGAVDPRKAASYYGPSQFDFWFYTGIDWTDAWRATFFQTPGSSPNYASPANAFTANALSVQKAMRHLIVPSNPVSNRVAHHDTDYTALPAVDKDPAGLNPNLMPDPQAGETPPRTSVNQATFGELWRAYWDVMVNPPAPGDTTIFRSSTRHPNVALATSENVLLRAGQAALNLVGMRDRVLTPPTGGWVESRPIPQISVNLGGTPTAMQGTVYAQQRQLYISEVYFNNDNVTDKGDGPNTLGYFAIELFNPSSGAADTIDLRDYVICSVLRTGTGVMQTGTLVPVRLHTMAGNTLGPSSYLVLDNYDASHTAAGAAMFRPSIISGGNLAGAPIYCNNLQGIRGQELFVLRSTVSLDTLSTSDPTGYAAMMANPMDSRWVPVDTFDFTGAGGPIPDVVVPGNTLLEAWHYVRQNTAPNAWSCVYPGRYDRAQPTRRHEGTLYHQWSVTPPAVAESEPAGGWVGDAWSGRAVNTAAAIHLGGDDARASYLLASPVIWQIPLNLANWPSPTANAASGEAIAPFGAFMRDGDILQVPFIGAHQLANGTTVYDMTPITMDAAFADDMDNTDDARETIGRFIPVGGAADPYAFADRLFNYVTAIQNPSSDTTPNINAAEAARAGAIAALQPVQNSTAAVGGHNEDGVPIQGKANINIAPWQVLAALPLVRMGDNGIATPAAAADATRALAKAIVRFRDIDDGTGVPHGPFRGIQELTLVPSYPAGALGETAASRAFIDAPGNHATVAFTQIHGELSPGSGVLDGFQQRMLAFTRISNLVTTRSDSFTAYIVMQAWMDAGTRYPALIAEQRRVMFIDRSTLSRLGASAMTTRTITVQH